MVHVQLNCNFHFPCMDTHGNTQYFTCLNAQISHGNNDFHETRCGISTRRDISTKKGSQFHKTRHFHEMWHSHKLWRGIKNLMFIHVRRSVKLICIMQTWQRIIGIISNYHAVAVQSESIRCLNNIKQQ